MSPASRFAAHLAKGECDWAPLRPKLKIRACHPWPLPTVEFAICYGYFAQKLFVLGSKQRNSARRYATNTLWMCHSSRFILGLSLNPSKILIYAMSFLTLTWTRFLYQSNYVYATSATLSLECSRTMPPSLDSFWWHFWHSSNFGNPSFWHLLFWFLKLALGERRIKRVRFAYENSS